MSRYGRSSLVIYRVPGTPVPLAARMLNWGCMAVIAVTPLGIFALVCWGLSRLGIALYLLPPEPRQPTRVRDTLEVSVEDGVLRWRHFYGEEVHLADHIPDVVIEREESTEDISHTVYVLTPRPALALSPVPDAEPQLTAQNGRLRIRDCDDPKDAETLRTWLLVQLGLPRPAFSWDLPDEPPPAPPPPESFVGRSAVTEAGA